MDAGLCSSAQRWPDARGAIEGLIYGAGTTTKNTV